MQRHTFPPIGKYPLPSMRFEHVHLDFIGPLPYCQRYTYCLTAVDKYMRWMEAMPLIYIEAITVARAFMLNWISRFGVPTRLTTDRGKQFEGHLFKTLSNFLGAEHHPTTSYHPQSNWILERTHRHLKPAITCHDSSNWIDALPLVLLGMQSAFKENIQATAAELVYG